MPEPMSEEDIVRNVRAAERTNENREKVKDAYLNIKIRKITIF